MPQRKEGYRVNVRDGKIISIEVICCGNEIGELRYRDGDHKTCPYCGVVHNLRIQYNHFHIDRLAGTQTQECQQYMQSSM